uniref:Uncharacterized protein n=1 Tax=Chrysemys picta bellii TaxID=8478 RepID=A0A8C3FCT8_CHRPI
MGPGDSLWRWGPWNLGALPGVGLALQLVVPPGPQGCLPHFPAPSPGCNSHATRNSQLAQGPDSQPLGTQESVPWDPENQTSPGNGGGRGSRSPAAAKL